MLKLNKNLKLNSFLTITLLIASSLGMQSTLADEPTSSEHNAVTQQQVALIDWSQKAQTALTARLEEKLQNQLIAKNYNIQSTHLAELEEPFVQNFNIVLAATRTH